MNTNYTIDLRNSANEYCHTFKQIGINQCIITGLSKNVKEGEVLKTPYHMVSSTNKEIKTTLFKVDEVLEKRTHRGVFKNKEDAKDAFFKVICSPIF